MPDHLLAVPEGYDPDSQAIVGLTAASLDDQSDQHVSMLLSVADQIVAKTARDILECLQCGTRI